MDSLQTQIGNLSRKVDALYQITEQISLRVTEALSDSSQVSGNANSPSRSLSGNGHYTYQDFTVSGGSGQHKDVIADADFLETGSQSGDRALAPEVQIQRLTAQLTAAYNRIAALEEQLLSHRVPS